ncbi:MAG: TlpA disulfide reductase family protein, partial [Polaribacter sp.]
MIKKTILVLALFFVFSSCKKEIKKDDFIPITTVSSYTYKELKPLLHKDDGKIYVVNFWATWCAPCVKELPYFEKLKEVYQDKNVEVLLVSLDFPKQIEERLIPFINKKKLKSKVVLLNDSNEDIWIKAIDSTWSGAIPAT